MTSTALATVIIVNYNGAHLLPTCLDGLAEQADDLTTFDTVVVDNASVDNSRELLAHDYPWVRVIASPTNLGFASGNNLALRQVTTPYAVLLNNDAVPQSGWLSNLLETFMRPGSHNVGIATGKVVFAPKFVAATLRTPGFRPASSDTRDLGVQIHEVRVNGVEVTDKTLWGTAAYGPEGSGDATFRWSRPTGEFLLPLPAHLVDDDQTVAKPVDVEVAVTAEAVKPVSLNVDGSTSEFTVGTERSTLKLTIEPGTPAVDVINNVGGIVLRDGSGADRGFQEVDEGQYDEPAEVFTACGNGMALRTVVGRELGWFDDAFFMYYEDTDLSWRWRSRGWSIEYVPTAVLRHLHSATSTEWSPRWRFFVERNRLLMLTKNASGGLAADAIWGYLRGSAGSLEHTVRDAVAQRRRPALRSDALRAHILLAYLRHAPNALRQRRAIHKQALQSRSELQKWLVASR
jgi:GT2 family glycosyltransferase